MGKSAVMTLLVILAAAASPASAQKETAPRWGEVGGWAIRVDRSIGDGCYAHQHYEDETFVRIGFDVKKGTIFFMIGNPGWRSLEAGKIYPMQLIFDGQQRYNGEFQGIKINDLVWLDHSNVSSDFAKDFMQRSSLRVFYQGNRIAALSLKNTYAAVVEVMNCQRELGGSSGGASVPPDPFGGGSRRPADPFSR